MKKSAKPIIKPGQKSRSKTDSEKESRFAKLQVNPGKPDSHRRHKQATRLAQLLKILEILQSRGRWNVEAMAQEIGCSERTIYRHFTTLHTFGIHPVFDKIHECYSLLGPVWFPAVNITEEEALGQATAAAITKTNGFDFSLGAQPVSRKLATKSDDKIAKILDEGERLLMVGGLQLANHREHREIIRTAQWALLKNRKVYGIYKSPYKSEPQKVELSPWRICLVKQAWYLIAKPSDSSEPRTYRLARFESLMMMNATALQPINFELSEYFGDAWAVFRGETKYDVEILFAPEAADLVIETEWHRSQVIKCQANGSITLSFKVDGLEEIVHWILGWSSHATVIQPPELKVLVINHLKKALQNYAC